jgi:hypothetical protein
MSLLGFDALGRLALGQLPGSASVSQALTARIGAMVKLRAQGTQLSALQAKITASAALKAQTTPTGVISARAKTQLSARAPGGVILRSIVNAQAKARTSPGYLLFARAMMASSGLSSLHLEGTTTPTRLPLLLNPGSQYGASYWKGRD